LKRLASALALGWLLWVEMENPKTHVWTQVDRQEFATIEACELARNGITKTAEPDGAGMNFMMSRSNGLGQTFVVNGDRVRISACMSL